MKMPAGCCSKQKLIGPTAEAFCFTTTASNIDVLFDANARIWWGDNTQSYSHNAVDVPHQYNDGLAEHTFCIEPESLTDVTLLQLDEIPLTGAIPPDLEQLTGMEKLRIYGSNALTGPIPPELGNLTVLRQLYLQRNNLTGPIPPELGNLTALRDIRLNNNALTGPIPPELGNLTALLGIRLYNNSLTGPIPAAIAAFAELSVIYLQSNSISNAHMSAFVDALWQNRVTLGANNCDILIYANSGVDSTATEQIEGTGVYLNDGLVQAGCTVVY